LEVGAEGGFRLDLRQDCDPGKQKLKGAVRTETYGAIITNTVYIYLCLHVFFYLQMVL
jgi:hypothetical protein